MLTFSCANKKAGGVAPQLGAGAGVQGVDMGSRERYARHATPSASALRLAMQIPKVLFYQSLRRASSLVQLYEVTTTLTEKLKNIIDKLG